MKNLAISCAKNMAISAAATIGAWGGLILLGQIIAKVEKVQTKNKEKKDQILKEES